MTRITITAIATFLIVAGLCAATNELFVAFADVDAYMAASERMLRMSQSADDTLARMIRDREVTWDPTNGEKMGLVLTHLKVTDRMKVLMVGSSQFLVVRDDLSETAWNRRIDRVVQRLSRKPVEVYNLSTGGMTARDKAVVIDRASQVEKFDVIVVGLTLWDSFSPKLRPPLDALPEKMAYATTTYKTALDYWLDPSGINRKGEKATWDLLERSSPFIRRRSAIQTWLGDIARGRLLGHSASVPTARSSHETVAGAEPIQYDYGVDDRREIIRNNVKLLLESLRPIKARGSRVAILLTPVRQDDRVPAYLPEDFYAQFVRELDAQCQADGFDFLDATRLLPPSHFGVMQSGEFSGKIDVLHFNAAGHKLLADFVVQRLGLK